MLLTAVGQDKHMNEQRNLLLAILVWAAILFGFQFALPAALPRDLLLLVVLALLLLAL